jgi:hypothetical protein
MNNQEFDRLLNSIREDQPDPQVVEAAGARVRERLLGGSELCTHFQAEFDAFRAGMLSESRRMLLEDHLHSCVACRRQFSGTVNAPVVQITSKRRILVWAAAAAVVIAGAATLPPVLDRALAPSGPRGTVASVDGTLLLVSDQGAKSLAPGADIGEGQEIRTATGSRAVVRLRDGSLVEVAERSDLRLTERWREKTVRLERGSVVVEAAKQGWRRLEIATPDCLVTVKGTIFSVSRGLKGSRVSVVQGEVAVDQSGASQLLNPGQQTTTNQSMALTTVATDVAWSQNAAKYVAMLADLVAISNKIDQIPPPGLRYSSRLLDRVPADSVIVVALPNLGQTLAEATQIIQDRAGESAALMAWWNGDGQKIRQAIDQVRGVSNFLGNEILLTVSRNGAQLGNPVILAEVVQPGLGDYLALNGFKGTVAFQDNLVVVGAATVPPNVGFSATPFGASILSHYSTGAGMIFAANISLLTQEQISSGTVVGSDTHVPTRLAITGIDNLQFLVAENKSNLGIMENTAALTFSGDRHGIASWITTPGPIGSLEFVSPDASFAMAVVTRNPRDLLNELLGTAALQLAQVATTIQQTTGVNPVDDIAGTLGGEATIAIDGGLFPVPSWKVAIEVNDPARLEGAIEKAVSSGTGVTLASQDVNGRTYHAITLANSAVEIDYVFVDGYWLLAANRGLIDTAIQARASALTLTHSPAFRGQLPLDGQLNFSALTYYNLGATVGPIVDQLKSTGLLTPDQQQQVTALTSNRAPTLVYAYGEPQRILVGSRGGITGLGLNAFTLPALFSSGLRQ